MSILLIGAGCEKLVYTTSSAPVKNIFTYLFSFFPFSQPTTGIAYYIPRHFWNKRSLIKEALFAQKLKGVLKQKGLSCDHLALELNFSKQRIRSRPTIETPLAEGTLEKEIRKSHLSFFQRLNLGHQFFKGLAALHAAGYAQGDPKSDNVLIVKKRGSPVVQLADWGRAKQLLPDQCSFYEGSLLVAPYEALCSHKGEVCSAGLVLINIIEEAFLSKSTSRQRLLNPSNFKLFHLVRKKQRGIFDYIYSHADISQNPLNLLIDLFRKKHPIQPTKTELNTQRLLHEYVNVLQDELVKNNCCSKTIANNLCSLIKRMISADPNARPTALEAQEKLGCILKNPWLSKASLMAPLRLFDLSRTHRWRGLTSSLISGLLLWQLI